MRLISVGLLLLLAALPARAEGIVTLDLQAESPLLGHPVRYALYTPDVAPPEGTRWPVLYLLHGFHGSDWAWFENTMIHVMLDEAIAAGTIRPMMVVAPFVDDSWYVDSKPFGPIDSALAIDLIAAIDASLPSAACRAGRAVAGISMGGAGAMLQAINHPDIYAAAIGFSPALHKPFPTVDIPPGTVFDAYYGIFGTPFDPVLYNEANAFKRIDRLKAAASAPEIYLVVGDDDGPDLIDSTALFHAMLKNEGLKSNLRVSAGGHNWAFWSQVMIPAFAWLSPKLDPTCGKP